MSITEQNMVRVGDLLTVEVASDLPPVLRITRLGPSGCIPRSSMAGTAVIHFHWYIDGELVASTTSSRYSFYLPSGDQVRVDVLDTVDPDFDAVANAPAGYPARRELFWTRNTRSDPVLRTTRLGPSGSIPRLGDESEITPFVALSHYRLEQQKDGGGWTVLARVREKIGVWEHRYRTARLTDLSTYSWRIVPVDINGNDGTVLTIGPEKIVRTPDAPNFTVAFNDGTQKATFAEVS